MNTSEKIQDVLRCRHKEFLSDPWYHEFLKYRILYPYWCMIPLDIHKQIMDNYELGKYYNHKGFLLGIG